MKMIPGKLFLSLFLSVCLSVSPVLGQNTLNSSTDLSKITVDQLSDDQVKSLYQKALDSGLSLDQLENMAYAKGMSRSEFAKLQTRMNKINTNFREVNETQSDRTRQTLGQVKVAAPPPGLFDNLLMKSDSVISPKLEDRIFGYSLFNTTNLTFEPSLNMPTPRNYPLGAGDEILIDVWGASQENYSLKVNPDGQIFIPRIGPVFVSGLTIDEASAKIKAKLVGIYAGLHGPSPNTFAQVTLGNIRSIQVMVVGEVNKPGTYTVSALSSVFNLLYLSGGPNKNGSFRNIEVLRDNKLYRKVDVYDFLLHGTQISNFRLQDQDIIRVQPYRWRVDIAGAVKRPALYEINDTSAQKLLDIIEYAGDFADNAYKQRVKIYRKTLTERSIRDVEYKDYKTFSLNDGDSIQVDQVLDRFRNRVTIEGAVFRPGDYSLDGTGTILQLLKKAEGIKGDALLSRASVYRTREDFSIQVIPVDLKALFDGSVPDLALQREDLIKIPSVYELKEEYTFEIEGEVKNPGIYPFIDNASVKDLILMSGGLLESASMSQVEVARRIRDNALTGAQKLADIFTFSIDRNLSISDSASKFVLEPFDQVFIRRAPGYMPQSLISVDGEVMYPGSYALSSKTERISDIIHRVGGFTPEAYPSGAQLVRKLSTNQREREQALRTIMQESSDSLKFNVSVKEREQAIGIDLKKIMENPGSDYDLILEEGDVLRIPKELQTVRLSGALLYPVSVRFDKSYSFRKYISEAGGFADDAKKSKTYVLYANGSIDKTNRVLFFNLYPKIQPGSEIIVPQKPKKDKISPQEALGMTSALTSVALILVTLISKL